MQIRKTEKSEKTTINKFKNTEIKENLNIEKIQEVSLSEILPFIFRSQYFLYKKINSEKNVFEDNVLNEKISVPIKKKGNKFYLKENDFKKLKELYEKEKSIHENSITFRDFCKSISKSYAYVRSYIKGNILEIPDKLNKIHKIPLIKLGQENYISKEDTEKYISINSKYLSLSDFSEELFNLDRKILWKKIKKDEEGYHVDVEFNELKYRLNLIQNPKSKQFYITKESYEEYKEFLKEKEKLLSNYILFIDFFKMKNVLFKLSYYKTIKNNEFRFIYKNKLHIMKIENINSNYYLDKEEVEKFNTQFSKTMCFSLDSLSTIISKKIKIQLKKKLEKLNCKDGEVELTYDDLNVKLNVYFFNTFYFSKSELEKVHGFMSNVNEKTKNLKHLYNYLDDKYKYKKVHKRLDKEKLILKDFKKKLFVRLKKVDNELYFNLEDEEKIKKIFN